MIHFDNVSKRYASGHTALAEVSFGIDAGEMVFVTGHSGAGKSTLLHLLGALDFPSPGEILSEGRALNLMSRSELADWRNREVGFIFQAYYLLPELDALENVCLPARMARIPAAVAAKRGRELLEQPEIKSAYLEGGRQQVES